MKKSTMSGRAGKSGFKRQDHYQELTDRVVAALENGVRPWQRPWNPDKAGGPSMPVNGATGRRYHGVNTLVLGMSMLAFEHNDPRWCTYRQANEKGWQVRRGQKATIVYFFKQLQVDDRDAPAETGEDNIKRIPLLRSFPVFHASQIDGIAPFEPPALDETPMRRPEAVDLILKNSKAVIRIGGDRAFYSSVTDHIQLPADSAFDAPEKFAAVAMHEFSHYAGAAHRLNRDLSGGFGSERYAREELIAEISSLMIGAELGLPTDIPNHASYVNSWIKILKNDKREIFRAAAAAQKCADYCLAFHPDYTAASAYMTGESGPDQDNTLAAAA